MVRMTNQQHQLNAEFAAGEKVAIYVNDTKVREYVVSEGNKALITFMYQEVEATQ